MKVARLYLRVSTEEQDLALQADVEKSTRATGYYVAGVYREKASGARANRPELLRMIADLQLDKYSSTIDFLLRAHRDKTAARR